MRYLRTAWAATREWFASGVPAFILLCLLVLGVFGLATAFLTLLMSIEQVRGLVAVFVVGAGCCWLWWAYRAGKREAELRHALWIVSEDLKRRGGRLSAEAERLRTGRPA